MIRELKLVNFRNFKEKEITNFEWENFIVWENWKWKTNILEAIARMTNNSITKLSFDDLIMLWEDYFFIEMKDENKSFSIYYSQKENKKSFMINNKKTSSKKFYEEAYTSVIFSPSTMNMFYLSPGLRRDFLDDTLKSSFPQYEKIQKDYKKILKSRNSILKAINEWKAEKDEIVFWNNQFIEKASNIYEYRFKLIDFLKSSIKNIEECFSWKIDNIELKYITKIEKENAKNDISNYLEKNFERDLILQKTHIWPHIDDFEILVDWKNIIQFASRWEVKSVIIYLKLLEGLFVERMTNKKPIMLIDDLLSELDNTHKDILLSKIKYYQTFITNINLKEKENNNWYITIIL